MRKCRRGAGCVLRPLRRAPAGDAPPPPTRRTGWGSISPRTAAILCYIPVVGWIAAVVVLATDQFRHNRTLRFHAFQGLYLFVAWLIVSEVLGPVLHPFGHIFGLGKILHALILFIWIFMIIKASQDEVYSLPVIGELAGAFGGGAVALPGCDRDGAGPPAATFTEPRPGGSSCRGLPLAYSERFTKAPDLSRSVVAQCAAAFGWLDW